MTNAYILILEFPDGSTMLASGQNKKYIIAQEGNQYLLNEIGDSLMDEGIIAAYQMAMIVGSPVRTEM